MLQSVAYTFCKLVKSFNQYDYIFCPHLLLFFSYIFGNSFSTHCPTSLYIIYIIFELEEKNWVFPFPICNSKLTIVRHVVLSLNPRKNLANTMYRFLRRKNKTEYMDFCGATLSKGRREVIQTGWRRKRTTLRYLRDWWLQHICKLGVCHVYRYNSSVILK